MARLVARRPEALGGGELCFYTDDGSNAESMREDGWFFGLFTMDKATLALLRNDFIESGLTQKAKIC